MRLWHQDLISKLPRQQLTEQHRECCALRGNGWGRKHSTVDYVFKYPPIYLYLYHLEIMKEMVRRKSDSAVNKDWLDDRYRGKNCKMWRFSKFPFDFTTYKRLLKETIYPEHNDEYLNECIDNLKQKGIEIK